MSDSLDDNSFDPQALEALLHDVPLELTVELGRIRLSLSDLAARLGPGSIITLDTPTGAPRDVRVNNRLVARAEAIAVGEKCGIRIVEIVGGKDA
jgi:flagellar motor switch protein FliN/FliY